jgi:hypothetical protein
MGRFTLFQWLCIKDAWRGCWTRANETASLAGGAILWAVLWLLSPYLRKIGIVEAPTTLWDTAGLTVGYAVASVCLSFGLVFTSRLIAAPARLYWAEHQKTAAESNFSVGSSVLPISKWIERADKTSPDLYETMFYLTVGNASADGKTLRRVQMRIFFMGEPELSLVKETGGTEMDLRHGEIALFEIGKIISEHANGPIDGSAALTDKEREVYEHNVPNKHIKFSTRKHNLANKFDGSEHTWRLVAVISADDSIAKHVFLDVRVDAIKSAVSIVGAP